MHYPPFGAAKDPTVPVITFKDGSVPPRRIPATLDPSDIEGVKYMYGLPRGIEGCATSLRSGESLARGEIRTSCSGDYTLAMQHDGNLVVYDASWKALWATGTDGSDASIAVMQEDGNFVVYGTDHHPHWASDTAAPGASIAMQDDGNLVIYALNGSAVWDR